MTKRNKKIILILTIFTLSIQLHGQVNSGQIKLSQDIFLKWSIKEFDHSKHSYEYCENSGRKYLCKIDGKKWYGSDWGMEFPKNELIKLILNFNGKDIRLDTSQMFNPNFSGSLYDIQFKLKKTGNTYMLYGFFSDGAGSYTVHWKIYKGKSTREKISDDEKDFEWQLTK